MRRLLGAATALILAGASLVAINTPAMAEPNPGIVVDGELSWTGEGQVELGDTLSFAGTWDAINAAPAPGDTFYIGLPDELGFDQALPFDLQGVEGNGNPVVWGSCLTNPGAGEVLCTLSDEVANWDEIHGSFELEVTAQQTTIEDEVLFDFNGQDGWVEVPGDGGIGDGIEIDDEVTKSGHMRDNRWEMGWQIEIPGSLLASSDDSPVQVLETLSDNHALRGPAAARRDRARW